MSERLKEDSQAIGVVLLAAGEGARMGGLPKCLIRIDGEPLIQRSLQAMREAGASRIVVVTGYYADAIEPLVGPSHAQIVRNPAPERGQGSSVSLGLAALAGGCAVVIVALAGQPLVGAGEVGELLAAFRNRADGERIVYPSVGGQRGNPVVLDGTLVQQLVDAGQAGAVRKFIDRHPEQVRVLQTPNEAFITDLDTRDDVAVFKARTGRSVDLPPADAG